MRIKIGRSSRRFFSRAMALWCALYMTLSPAMPLFAQVSEEVQAVSTEAEAAETESETSTWDAESISLQGGLMATSMDDGEGAPSSLTGNSSSQGQAGLAVNASVNPFTGSFSSGLSIRVPAGRQGMQPNLSVGYDSSSGNGLLGVGWGLTKNLIFRSGRNKGTPQFNETDEFYLSLAGSTLKLTPVEHCECGAPCAMREFRTRTESFSKVIAHYDATYVNRVVYWEVFGKTGMRYTFGTAPNSQLPNVQWYLDYTEDTSGNFMEFIYDGRLLSEDPEEDDCAGLRAFDVNAGTGLQSLNHVLLSEVKYTGNSVKGDDPHNSVQLVYEPRPDVITSYRTTFRQELKDRLERIEVYSNDTFLLWEYVFGYTPSASSPSGRSLLTSIQQFGRLGATLPPVVFEYQEGDVRWDKTGPFPATIPGQAFLKNSDPGQRYGQGARLADFDGDGRVDKVDSYTKRNDFCDDITPICTYVSGQCVADPGACARAPLEEEVNQVFLHTGAGWTGGALAGASVPGLPFDERWKNSDGTVQAGPGGAQLADVNGDGLADKLDFKVFEDYECQLPCSLSDGSCVSFNCYPEPVGPQTVNDVYLHAGFGWSDAPHPALLLPGLPLVERVGRYKVTWRDRGARLVDVNGDGRADKVDFHRDSDETDTRDVYLNLGDSDGDGEHDGWLPAPKWSDSLPGEPFSQLSPSGLSGWPAHTVDLGTRLIDMNADGLPDKVDFYRIHYVSEYSSSSCPTMDCPAECDPLLRDDAVFSVYFNTGRGWEAAPDPALSFVMSWNGYNSADRPFGLPFAYVKRRVKCQCDVGCYFSPFTTNTAPEGAAAIDFNGDGLPDKVDWDNNGANQHSALLVNDGNGWQEIDTVQDAEFSNNIDFVVLMKGRGLTFDDADADGLLDGIQSFLDQTAPTKRIRLRVGPFPDLLSAVHNGTGGTTRVSYAPAASFAHEPILQDWNGAPERNWVSGYDNPVETVEWNLPHNMQVVASVTASDGRVADESDPDFPRHNYTTRYEYAGGFFDPVQGEFQGFRRVRTVEDATGNFSDTYFKQEGRVSGVDLLLPPGEQEARKGPFSGLTEHALAYEAITPLGVNEDATPANSILLAETFNQYEAVRNIPDPEDPAEWADIFQIELARSDTWTFESQLGASVFKLRTAVSHEYDDFGNVTNVLQHGAVYSWLDHVSEQRIFINDTAQWRLGYALSERVAWANVENVLCEPQLVCSPDPAIGCRIRCPYELQTGRQFPTYREKQFFYDGLPFQEVGARGLRTKEEQVLSDYYLPRPLPESFVTTAQYDYDDYGNLVSITDAKGNTTTMAYDPVLHQFLLQTVNALGHANTVEYNEAGQVLTSTDANGVTSFTDYDNLWRPVASKVRPAGSADVFILEEYIYNDALLGDPWAQHTETRTYVDFTTVPTGDYLWSKSYFDGMGRSYMTERKGDAGKVIVQRSLFNDRGLVEFVSKPFFDGEGEYYVETEYDSKGRAVLVTAPDLSVTQTVYDGLETTVIDAEGKQARTKVDAYGRTVEVTEFEISTGQSFTTKYSYLPTGELNTVIDALGTVVAFMRYDTWGRKRRIRDIDTEKTTYEYDLNSNLVLQYRGLWPTDPLWFEYDPLDRLTRKEYENGDEVLYEYDDPAVSNGIGRLTRRTERNGDISTFGYDSFGRIINTTKETVIDGQTAVLSVETEWDALGRQKMLTYPDGFSVEYFYNDAGQLEQVVGSDGVIYAHYPDYNASGQFTHVGLGNGITTDYAYDPLNDRLTNLFTQTSVSSALQDLSYGFDDVGNVVNIIDALDPARSQTFLYDDFHRLGAASGPYGALFYDYDAIGNITHKGGVDLAYDPVRVHQVVSTSDGKSFTYDMWGNMVTKTEGSTVTSYEWDEENRLMEVTESGSTKASFEYDTTGNRIRKITSDFERIYFGDYFEIETKGTGFVTTKHVFAGNNRIATVSEETSQLAFFGTVNQHGYAVMASASSPKTLKGLWSGAYYRALSFSYTDTYRASVRFVPSAFGLFAFLGLCLIARRRARESVPLPAFALWRRHARLYRAVARALTLALILYIPLVFMAPPAYAQATPAGTFYYHGDHLGSSSVITDLNGNIVEEKIYKPFGEFHEPTDATSVKHYYTGQELDEETDLYYYGARYYNPEIARFISADSIVASPFDPQDLNRYAYVRNNPIIYVDPTGHGFWAAVGIAALIGAIIGGVSVLTQGTNVAMGMLGGAIAGAVSKFGFVVRVGASALHTMLFGGDFTSNLFLDIGSGVLTGFAPGAGRSIPRAAWSTAIRAGMSAAIRAGMSAAIYGGNVLEAALRGAATSMVLASASYGVAKAAQGIRNLAANESGNGSGALRTNEAEQVEAVAVAETTGETQLTPEEGEKVLNEAEALKGTEYPSGEKGITYNPDGSIETIDCSHLCHVAYDRAGYEYEYRNTTTFATDFKELGFKEITAAEAQAGDIVLFKGHMGLHDPSPPYSLPVKGVMTPATVLSAQSGAGKVTWSPPQYFSGTPRYFRYTGQ